MKAQDLRNLLEQTADKLSIFASPETLKNYKITVKELLDLISDFLSDEEKMRLFNYSHFIGLDGWIKEDIIRLVSDENILLHILSNDNIIKGLASYRIVDIIKKMSDSAKQQVLHNQDFIEKHQIGDYELTNILSGLSDEARTEILGEIDLITNRLKLNEFRIAESKENCSKYIDYQIILRLIL